MLIFDRCVELGGNTACTGAFWISLSIGSVGVDDEDVDSDGSPAGTKVCCNSCSGDRVWVPSSGRVIAEEVANGEGLAGRENVCLSLPKTRLGVSGSVVAPTALGTLCCSMSSLLLDRASSPVLCLHLSSWSVPRSLWISLCFPSNLSSLSGCQSSTGILGSALSVPVGQTNRNGFSGNSLSTPQFSTNWGSVAERS